VVLVQLHQPLLQPGHRKAFCHQAAAARCPAGLVVPAILTRWRRPGAFSPIAPPKGSIWLLLVAPNKRQLPHGPGCSAASAGFT